MTAEMGGARTDFNPRESPITLKSFCLDYFKKFLQMSNMTQRYAFNLAQLSKLETHFA